MLAEQLVQRAGEVEAEQAAETRGGEAGALERERLAVGEAHTDHLDRGARFARDEDARAGDHALACELLGQPAEGAQIPLELRLRDEGASVSADRPAQQATGGEPVERVPDGHAGDAVRRRELPLGRQPVSGR